MISKTFWHTGSSVLAIEWSESFLAINILKIVTPKIAMVP